MIEKIKKLEKTLNSKFYYDYETKNLTWFRTGGKAKVFIVVENFKDLENIIKSIGNTKYYIVGAGSNLLVRDNGFNGILIKLGKKFNEIKLKQNENKLVVGSSNLMLSNSNLLEKFVILFLIRIEHSPFPSSKAVWTESVILAVFAISLLIILSITIEIFVFEISILSLTRSVILYILLLK